MFTDFVGNQIDTDDQIVYAQSAYGGGAVMKLAEILKIVPLHPHPSGSGYAREDQMGKQNPTKFSGEIYKDPSKRYVIQIDKEKWRYVGGDYKHVPTKYTIPHSNSVIKVIK